MWKILFEDSKGNVVDEVPFSNYNKAKDCFQALVLQDFAKAALCREDGTLMDLKVRG